jgi:hypothetical protein
MPDVPRHVQARGPDYVGPNLRVFYQPTNTRRDLPRMAGAQKRLPMDEFLLSDDLQDVLMAAGADMVDDAQEIAIGEGLVESGGYVSSFEARRGDIVAVNDGEFANPRVSTDVLNTDAAAAAVEFGNKRVGPGHRVLGRVAAKYDNPRGGT